MNIKHNGNPGELTLMLKVFKTLLGDCADSAEKAGINKSQMVLTEKKRGHVLALEAASNLKTAADLRKISASITVKRLETTLRDCLINMEGTENES